jgi:hypothetical protein
MVINYFLKKIESQFSSQWSFRKINVFQAKYFFFISIHVFLYVVRGGRGKLNVTYNPSKKQQTNTVLSSTYIQQLCDCSCIPLLMK